MNAKLKLAIFIMLTAVSGVGVVTWETPQNLLLFAIWSAVALICTRRLRTSISGKAALVNGVTHASVMAIIITIAIVAPVKRIDAVLRKRVQLQSDTMTVAELSEFCRLNRKSLPLSIHIPGGGAAAERQVRFSGTQMPLEEFIAELEQQTGCSHQFCGCGNAYSILYGSAYDFGLSFTPPAGYEFKWE